MYDRNPYVQQTLLEAMVDTCGDVSVESIQGFLRHTRAFFPCCLARANIMCDVDEMALRRDDENADAE